MNESEKFQRLTSALESGSRSYVLAELNDLLTAATGEVILALPRPSIVDPYLDNYVAAMVECAAHRREVLPPAWTSAIEPLGQPVFAVSWLSLRPHLLLHSPPPFRRRNIFIDSTIGDRV